MVNHATNQQISIYYVQPELLVVTRYLQGLPCGSTWAEWLPRADLGRSDVPPLTCLLRATWIPRYLGTYQTGQSLPQSACCRER